MKTLRIAILGTRGIPNQYGGFEQAATYLAAGLVKRGHQVTVYNSNQHPYKEKSWQGAEIVHCYDPEPNAGTAGQFIYDFNCIRHARRRAYDILLFLGYTSSSVWGRFYPRKPVIVSNMDGLEWKRSKYRAPVRKYLKLAEKWAVKFSHFLIADSPEIQSYLQQEYQVNSAFIAYGAEIPDRQKLQPLTESGLEAGRYYLLIARMEPENHIELILDGYVQSGSRLPFIVVGNLSGDYGKRIEKRYKARPEIRFTGGIFDQLTLQRLRAHCRLYFHGHSVGGTNPSLLEAMASGIPIAAHDNRFNRAVLGTDAAYFSNAADIRGVILNQVTEDTDTNAVKNNLEKISRIYNWEKITDQYEDYLLACYRAKHS